MPKVTVLITTYNCGKFLPEAIESIRRQKYVDYEILIIDDGSTDDTEEVLSHEKDIRYYKNETNKGIAASCNLGLDLSKGEYIARMDADDVMFGNRLEDQVRFLDNNKDYGLVGGWYHVIDAKGNMVRSMTNHSDSDFLKLMLLFRNQFAQPSITPAGIL
jgi:glycosyltransferase involved in cell wall biosynthesis